jgi:hypothetical protein
MSIAICKVTHVPTAKTLIFPMIIKTFEYDISPSFTRTNVYGRMDPIFTYQQTVRKFIAILATPGGATAFTRAQKDVFISSGVLTQNDFNGNTIGPQVTRRYLGRIADLFKMMYPLYNSPRTNDGTGFIAAAPLLRLDLEGLTHKDDAISGMAASVEGLSGDELGRVGESLATGLLFVPENFKVTSIVDSSKVGMVVGSAADMRFTANSQGYVVTLGGTILHEDNHVGMYWENDNVVFGQGRDFPFATQGTANLFGSPSAGPAAAPPEAAPEPGVQSDPSSPASMADSAAYRDMMDSDTP